MSIRQIIGGIITATGLVWLLVNLVPSRRRLRKPKDEPKGEPEKSDLEAWVARLEDRIAGLDGRMAKLEGRMDLLIPLQMVVLGVLIAGID